MALDFPSSPTNGQAYGSYIYNSTVGAWQSKEDPATVATVSTTAPATGNPGDLWYDSDDGTSYMYYDDGTSAQWVELLSSGLPLLSTKANISGGNTFTSTQSITSAATTQVPLIVNGIASQTAPLQQWKDSSGTALSAISSNGSFVASATGMDTQVGVNALSFSRANASYIDNISIGGNLSQRVSKTVAADTVVWNSSVNGLSINPSGTLATTATPLTVKGTASQTADLQQWQNSSGTVLAEINSLGSLLTPSVSDLAYNRILNPAGAYLNSVSSSVTGAIRIVLPVGWTDHMHKFTVSVFHYLTGKSFTVEIAGYNYTGGYWVNPTAYIVGQQNIDVNYTVRFGYTAGGKACVYIGETTSVWSYLKVAVNNVLVGQSGSSSTWLSGWVVDTVTAFENVSQTVTNTQIVSGLVPLLPTSVSVNSGSASVSSDGTVSFSGGVTNLRVNGCFSSTYRYYRVMYEVEATSSGMDLMFQLINLGSGYVYGRIGTYSGPTFTQTYASGSAAAMMARSNGGNGSGGWLDVINPSHAKTKRFLSQSVDSGFMLWLGSINGDLGTYSDFQIYSLQGGTLTSGSLKVYGYR